MIPAAPAGRIRTSGPRGDSVVCSRRFLRSACSAAERLARNDGFFVCALRVFDFLLRELRCAIRPGSLPHAADRGLSGARCGLPAPAGEVGWIRSGDNPEMTYYQGTIPSALPAPRNRAVVAADVLGGIALAVFAGIIMINFAAIIGLGAAPGAASTIAWESVWLLAAMFCAPFLPSAVRHNITWNSTGRGFAMNWPEAFIAATLFFPALVSHGAQFGFFGPLGAALAIGAAEEFIFRILLLGWLATRIAPEKAVLVSAIVFGLAHLQELSVLGAMSCISQFAGGVVLGAIYLRTANPLGPILLHGWWDFAIFFAYGMSSGGSTEAGMPSIQDMWFPIAMAIYGMWLMRPSVDSVGRTPEMTMGQPIQPVMQRW
jgi:membrane protease YdiL (CAAX protease family)